MAGGVAWVHWMEDREDPVRGLFVGLVRAKFQRENPLARASVPPEAGAARTPSAGRAARGALGLVDGAPHATLLENGKEWQWSEEACLVVPDLDLAVSTAKNLGSRVLFSATGAKGQRIAVVTDAVGDPVALRE